MKISRNKLILSAFGLVVIALISFFMWPLSLSIVFDDISDNAVMYIVVTDTWAEVVGTVVVPRSDVTRYTLERDSEKFREIQQILDRYSYRRSLRTFFSDASMSGNDAGFWLQLYVLEEDAERRSIITGGTREIIVNTRVYRIGYWRNRANTAMMNEIRGVIDELQALPEE